MRHRNWVKREIREKRKKRSKIIKEQRRVDEG